MSAIMLYFGSFNPIHNGHTAIARYVLENGYCDRLLFVVSPQNPMKHAAELATEEDRLHMARIAISERLRGLPAAASDIEFGMPRPSYTVDTLGLLRDRFPSDEFCLLLGTDILPQLPHWKNSAEIIKNYKLFIYPRDNYVDSHQVPLDAVYMADAPRIDISSTRVRERVACGEDISGMVAPGVDKYIRDNELWRTTGCWR